MARENYSFWIKSARKGRNDWVWLRPILPTWPKRELVADVKQLREANPKLRFRICRLRMSGNKPLIAPRKRK